MDYFSAEAGAHVLGASRLVELHHALLGLRGPELSARAVLAHLIRVRARVRVRVRVS